VDGHDAGHLWKLYQTARRGLERSDLRRRAMPLVLAVRLAVAQLEEHEPQRLLTGDGGMDRTEAVAEQAAADIQCPVGLEHGQVVGFQHPCRPPLRPTGLDPDPRDVARRHHHRRRAGGDGCRRNPGGSGTEGAAGEQDADGRVRI